MKRDREQGPAPMLAAEEQERGDNLVRQIGFRQAAGFPVGDFQVAARNAFETAAAHEPQPERGWS